MAYNAAHDKYRALWKRDAGPQINGWKIDYSYYSPMDYGADSEKTYPLCVVLVGALEGLFPGLEIQANEMALWSAPEYQQRFHNGAAYLMVPRAPEETGLYWDGSCLVESLRGTILDFCERYQNVDPTRIYLLSWCVGSLGAINMAASYPEMFAATVLMCPSRTITNSEALRMREMPLWMVTALTDTHAIYPLETLPSWNKMKKLNPKPETLRRTTFTRALDVSLVPQATISSNHNVWDWVAEDCHFIGPGVDHERVVSGSYKGEKTIDGTGAVIEDPYMISWLNRFTNEGRTAIREPVRNGSPAEKAHIWFHEGLSHWGRITVFKALGHIYRWLGWLE
ncbi:MAG: hypothetical protein IKN72_04365 [Clostridia bacterium]|nr:hypothetical protein [Clostridia bacterium]